MAQIKVLENTILTKKINEEDYICITDIAKYKDNSDANDIIKNWFRNRNTIEFLGIWEKLNNPTFKPVEFDIIKSEAGLNSFTMSGKKWIEKTNAIKHNIIPKLVNQIQANYIYASEADILKQFDLRE